MKPPTCPYNGDESYARPVLMLLFNERDKRAPLFGASGNLLAEDSTLAECLTKTTDEDRSLLERGAIIWYRYGLYNKILLLACTGLGIHGLTSCIGQG